MWNEVVGVGVVGYGYWGPNLARNFGEAEAAQLVAVCDMDPAKLGLAKRRHPAAVITREFRDLLTDSRVDAIAIATPAQTHYQLALAALRAGKHVLVEKPLTQSSEQALQLVEEAERQRLVLMVDHTFVYTPAVQKIRELIVEGTLGDIYYYNGIRASLGLFQSDVNVIWDLAVHDVSIIQYILNEQPVAVSATGVNHVAGAPANMAHITLFFPNSCIAHISVNWLSPVKVRQTFIGGSRKMIVYDDVEASDKLKLYDKGITLTNTTESAHQLRIGYRTGDMWVPHLPAKEALLTEAEHFISCIRSGASPISNGMTGVHVVRDSGSSYPFYCGAGQTDHVDEPASNSSGSLMISGVDGRAQRDFDVCARNLRRPCVRGLAPREQGKPKLTIPITHREPATPTLVADFAGVPLWKRGLDICGVLFAIATLLPMLLLIAIAIKLGSKGPLLFKQERVGLFGKRFMVVKFRTMMAGADPAVHETHAAALIESNTPMTKLDAHGDPRAELFWTVASRDGRG